MRKIIAMEVFGTPYMTQVKEVPFEERGYWTRALGLNINVDEYRGATQEERDAWKAEIDKINSEEYNYE